MVEVILAIISLSILGYHAYYVHSVQKEKGKLINALISKNAEEMTNLELADKTKIEVGKPKEREDLVPVSELDDEEFKKLVLEQNA